MSLINDALQRAKHQTAPAANASANLQLRPAEPPPASPCSGRVITFAFIGILVTAGAAVPLLVRDRISPSPETARAAIAPTPPAIPEPAPIQPQNPGSKTTIESVQANPAATSSAAESVANTMEAPTPEQTSLKLNGIFFNAAKPSAIVNGKTVFPNSRVGDFTVHTITADSVQLVSATATNVLRMDHL